MIRLILKAIGNTCGVKVVDKLYYSKDRTDILIREALAELEELEQRILELEKPKLSAHTLCDGCIYAVFPLPDRCRGCVRGKMDYYAKR